MIGLLPPRAFVSATEDYVTEEDTVDCFIAESCELNSAAPTGVRGLFEGFKKFWDGSGTRAPMSQESFSQKLERHGLIKGQDSKSKRVLFLGTYLKRLAGTEDSWSSQ
jgi:phage/plasmid-associated DNA primase